jgi:hypothetical protein
VIYLDGSVALAHLLAGDRFPAEDLWRQQLVSSRLLEWNTRCGIGFILADSIGRMAMQYER